MTIEYDPNAQFDIHTFEESFRQTASRALLARVYQPEGDGPFPVVLDLHGGAWNNKDRTANQPMDEALAASGVLVVAVDLTLAGESPYPASVRDAHYAVRWLKARASEWKGNPRDIGLLGSSSGGHLAQLVAMQPHAAQYGNLALPGHPDLDATVRYIATRSPISDPHERYLNAERRGAAEMVRKSKTFFDPWETIFEANPQRILERGDATALPPMLLMQGALDDNVLPELQVKFASAYRAAGGECQLEIFEGCGHIWVADPGPQTDRAHAMLKDFVARQLAGVAQGVSA